MLVIRINKKIVFIQNFYFNTIIRVDNRKNVIQLQVLRLKLLFIRGRHKLVQLIKFSILVQVIQVTVLFLRYFIGLKFKTACENNFH